MRNIVFGLLMVIAFQIPWEELAMLGTFGTLVKAIGIAAAFLGIVAVLISGRMRGLLLLHYFMIMFVGFAALSIFWSQETMSPVGKIVTFAQLLAFSWLIWEFAPDLFRQKLLLHAYVWGAGLGILIQFLGMRGYVAMLHEEERYAAGIMNANQFGFLLLIAIPFAVYCILDSKTTPLLRLAYALFIPVCAIGVMLTGSRMAFLTGAAMAAMIGVLYLFKRPVAVIVIGLIAGAIFSLMFTRFMPESTWDRLLTTYDELTSGTWSGRFIMYQGGLTAFQQYPLLGTGCGSFAVAVSQYVGVTSAGQTAHNTYLCVLVELGVIGFLLFVAVLMASLACIFKMPFRERCTWLVIFAGWGLCAFAGTMEAFKATWFILAMISCQYAVYRPKSKARAQVQAQGLVDPRSQLPMRSRWGNPRGT
jgi:O-antigen ligase